MRILYSRPNAGHLYNNKNFSSVNSELKLSNSWKNMYKATDQRPEKVCFFPFQDMIVKSGQILGNLIIYTAMHRLQIIKSK